MKFQYLIKVLKTTKIQEELSNKRKKKHVE